MNKQKSSRKANVTTHKKNTSRKLLNFCVWSSYFHNTILSLIKQVLSSKQKPLNVFYPTNCYSKFCLAINFYLRLAKHHPVSTSIAQIFDNSHFFGLPVFCKQCQRFFVNKIFDSIIIINFPKVGVVGISDISVDFINFLFGEFFL